MRKNLLPVILSVVIAVSLIAGSTYAWFTAASEPIVNEFTAGTVEISAGYAAGFTKIMEENWNPGDCTETDLEIINEGTKSIYLRAKIEKRWLPSMLRVLVVYTGRTVQLLAIEWDSFCKGFTGAEGPIAEGQFYIGFPSQTAYIDGTFINLDSEDYIQNGVTYSAWCLDNSENILKGVTYDVEVYDPMCNPDWYNEADTKGQWANIPWEKIVYIVNGDFLNRGYNSDDIQNAIWHYTNQISVSGEALEIVNETEANWELPSDNVTIDLGPNWAEGSDGYWYYMAPVPGSYTQSDILARTVLFDSKVCLEGELTGNMYQGKVFSMTTFFEAVQSSNGAVDDVWPGNPY
ncbi:MAG: TasA family protein [Eubacteriales bacterium]|nr:TasA family protein [Eubacteriales bacterium]MDD4327566.1 TasA family protein [Eubacteriales bacterium]MDD4717084.1 TasA family protein [Eubacteriales bacterium]